MQLERRPQRYAAGWSYSPEVVWYVRFVRRPFSLRALLTLVALQSSLGLALGCEEPPPECLQSIAVDDYAPCAQSCEDGNAATCEFLSAYLGDRCSFDDNLSACQFLCARGESMPCDRIPRILSMTPSATPATEPVASNGATDVRQLEEQLSVRTHELLGHYRLALPGPATLESSNTDA